MPWTQNAIYRVETLKVVNVISFKADIQHDREYGGVSGKAITVALGIILESGTGG